MTQAAVTAAGANPPPGKPRPRRSRLGRLLVRLTIGLLCLALLVVGLLALVLFSEPADRWLLNRLERWLPQLQLEGVSGSLAQGLQIDSVRWRSDSFRLELDNVRSRWQLQCLRRSSFCLDYLRADRALIWTAASDEPEASEPFDGVHLPEISVPWQFNVEQLHVEDLSWQSGEQEPMRFGLVDIRGVVAGHDWALHEVHWRFDDTTLGRGDLTLAGHLATAGDYPINAELQGSYAPPGVELPFERWQLRAVGDLSELGLDLLAAGRGAVHLNGEIDLTQASLPLRLKLESQAPIDWQKIRIEQADLSLSGSLEGYEIAADTQLQLSEQPPFDLSLRGRGDLKQLQVERLRARAKGGSLTLNGDLAWADGVQWQGRAKLQRLDPSSWAPEWPGQISGQADTEFRLQDSQWALTLARLDLQGTLRERPLALSGNVRRSLEADWLLDQLALRLGENRILADGQVNHGWNLKGELNLPNLAAFAPELDGSLTGSWQVEGSREDPRLQITAQSPTLAYGAQRVETLVLKADLAPLTLNRINVDLTVAHGQLGGESLSQLLLQAEGNAQDHRVHLETGYRDYDLSASAQGRFDPKSRDWQGQVRDLALGRAAVGGQPPWRMTQKEPAALAWTTASQHLELAPLCLADPESGLCAGLDYRGKAQRIELTTDIDRFLLARIQPFLQPFAEVSGRLSSKGRLLLERGKLKRAELQGSAEQLQISRVREQTLATPFHMPALDWQADFENDRLQADIGYWRSDAERGRISGSVDQLSKLPDFNLKVDISELSLAEVAALAGLDLQLDGTAGADLSLRGTLKNPQVNGTLQARDVTLAGSKQEALAGDEEGEPWVKNLDLTSRFAGNSAEVELAWTAPAHLTWTPEAPARLTWQGEQAFTLTPSCWSATDSRLCLEADWAAGKALQAKLALNALAATALAPLLPEGLELSGDAAVQAGLSKAEGEQAQLHVEASLQDGEVLLSQDNAQPLKLPFETLALAANLADRRVQGQLDLGSEALGQGGATFDIPLAPGAPVVANWNLQDIQIAPIRPFFPQLSELAGQLAVQGRLAGTLADPLVDGSIRLSDGRFASPNVPLTVDNLDALVRIDNNRATLDGTFTSGKGKGSLSGDGWLGADWRANVQLRGEDIPVVQRPEINLIVQPNLTLKAQVGEIFLGGRIEITKGLLELKPLPPSAVEVSPDVVFIDETAPLEVDDATWKFRTNLTVAITDQVLLKGYGAQAKMKGSVTVIQDERDVLIGRGTLDIVEGRYEKFGQRLKIRGGQILFNGPIERPYINIEAVRETETVVAGLRLSGPADEPTLSLFSEPSLPDDTIMYYLLTGNAPGTGAGVGDDQAMANRALLGIGLYGGTPIAEEVAEKFGVEEFDITTSGQGDTTAVNVSGYLSPRLYVQYGIGVFSPVNTLTLRYKLRPNLFVEAVNGVENILDLLYTFEF